MQTNYKSIEGEHHIKQKVGACRFFGSTKAVKSEEEAFLFIEYVKEKFPNANHYVYAYRIGVGKDMIERYTDDGEPTNSSGPPALQSISGRDLTNVVVVVTRYYGGVNQGVGGLIRAYGSTASLVLDEAKVVKYYLFQEFKVKPVEYNQLGDIIHFVEQYNGKIIDIEYGANVSIKALLENELLDKFKIKARDITKGDGNLILGELVWKRKK
ncbi:MAG: IMPACT family protein [Clostridia bacterium]